MKSRKFDHFQIFKLVITSIYVVSGFLMFGMLISNAREEFRQDEVEITEQYIDCMNCDEID